jgi:carbonic anhydrase/acetyltransferase-like protein (isoleucine patch superfamily)
LASEQIRGLLCLGAQTPRSAAGAWVAPGAVLVGDVDLGRDCGVWYTAVLRADGDRVVVGEESNVQDGCILHADPGLPVVLGRRVTVGHRAVLHGCTVDDDVLVGMGAVVLNGAHVHSGSLLAAGTVVPEGMEVPPDSLVAGVPGRVRRQTTDAEREMIVRNAAEYVALKMRHAAASVG